MDVLVLTANTEAGFMQRQLAAIERRGVSFSTVGIPGRDSETDQRSALDYVRAIGPFRRTIGDEFDLVHAQYGLTAPIALTQRRLPVVLSLWGSDVHGPVAPISSAAAPLCDEVVVMSTVMARRVPCRCAVIPNGVDLERFRPTSREEARAVVGWAQDAYQVIFPYPPYRPVKDYPRAKQIVHAAADRLDRPVNLQVVHGLSHDEYVTHLNAADALLLTSRSEGSPNTVKEALACNVPVVSTAVGDVPERLVGVEPSAVSADDAVLVDGLCDVLERGERSNGREAVKELGIERTAAAMHEVYERAVTGR